MTTETSLEHGPETLLIHGMAFRKKGSRRNVGFGYSSSQEYEYGGVVITRAFDHDQKAITWRARYIRGDSASVLDRSSPEDALRSMMADAERQLRESERNARRADELLAASRMQVANLASLLES